MLVEQDGLVHVEWLDLRHDATDERWQDAKNLCLNEMKRLVPIEGTSCCKSVTHRESDFGNQRFLW